MEHDTAALAIGYLPPAEFETAPVHDVAFTKTDPAGVEDERAGLAVLPAAMAGAAALGLGFWHRRQRSA